MHYTSYIELNKSALNNNIRFMQEKSGKGVRYSLVVKSNAYGHGIEYLLPLVEACGVDHISVFSVEEARRAIKVKRKSCDLMIMGFIGDNDIQWAVENDISFFVFTKERLDAVCKLAPKLSKQAHIHVELETGMHRTGFCEDELEYVARKLQENPHDIKLEGLCTHFAGAENLSNFDRVQNQIETFHRLCSWFRKKDIVPRYRHIACSAGVLNFPESVLDMVRIGIVNYGFWPSDETRMWHLKNNNSKKDPLKQVLSWKSEVMSVNRVEENQYVSYGHSYLTSRDSKIATIPVGYGYGFSRNLSNLGHVLINKKRVPVVGSVNMNMMVVDVTDLPDVKVGDEVVLIGQQGDMKITISSFSDMNNSMNYELLTRLPEGIPRYTVE